MKVIVLIEKGADGTYAAYTSNTQSTIVGEGNTREEAIEDFECAVRELVDFYAEEGEDLPEELQDMEFEFQDYN